MIFNLEIFNMVVKRHVRYSIKLIRVEINRLNARLEIKRNMSVKISKGNAMKITNNMKLVFQIFQTVCILLICCV